MERAFKERSMKISTSSAINENREFRKGRGLDVITENDHWRVPRERQGAIAASMV